MNRLVGLAALLGLAPACGKKVDGEAPQPQKAAVTGRVEPLVTGPNKRDLYVQEVPAGCKVQYAGVPIRFTADVADYRRAFLCK